MCKFAVWVISWAMRPQHNPRVPLGIKLVFDSQQVNWLKKGFLSRSYKLERDQVILLHLLVTDPFQLSFTII